MHVYVLAGKGTRLFAHRALGLDVAECKLCIWPVTVID